MIEPDRTRVSRVVVRPPNWLGDAVLALPAMTALRQHFASASLTIAASPAVAALCRESTDVKPDEVVTLPSKLSDGVRLIRDGTFDLGVLFPNSFGSAWMLRRAGVPQRWGIARNARGWLLTRRSVRARNTGAHLHQADYYRHLVRGFGIPCDDGAPAITVSPSSHAAALTLLQGAGASEGARLVGLAPGAAYGQAKQWPPERVAELVARLVRDRAVTCVLVGAAHDRRASRDIESWLRAVAPEARSNVIDLVGQTDLGGLVGLAAQCRVFVTNDSGAMHVASALGTPVVALFGPTDERVTRPVGRGDVLTAEAFCRPCHLRDCPIDHRCMKRITVDTVFAAVSRHLAFSGTRSTP